MAYRGFFCRAMENGGTGVNSAVADATSSAVATTAVGTRTISTVAMSVAETSEYVQAVQFTVDGAGSSPTPLYVVASVTLVWVGFTTPPTLTQA
jgi:integral membrane sensor domain MASE1